MGEPRSTKSLSPHSVAAVASTLVLVVGLGLGLYFIELRGPGLQALLAGSQAQEILILFGAIAAIALTGHIAIANAVRQSRASQAYRRLIHRALEMDHTDPAVLRQFEMVPELRDLVSSLIAEKSQTLELSDQIESLRGEVNGLIQGMGRSIGTLGPLREDSLSDLGRKVSVLWNEVVERARQAEEKAATTPSTSTLALEKSDDVFASSDTLQQSGGDDATERIEKLEGDVERLWTKLESLPFESQPSSNSQPQEPVALAEATNRLEPESPFAEPVSVRDEAPVAVPAPAPAPGLLAETPESSQTAEKSPPAFAEDPLVLSTASLSRPSGISDVPAAAPAEVTSASEGPRFSEWGGLDSLRPEEESSREAFWGSAESTSSEQSEAAAPAFGATQEPAPTPASAFTEETFTPPFAPVGEEAVAPVQPQAVAPVQPQAVPPVQPQAAVPAPPQALAQAQPGAVPPPGSPSEPNFDDLNFPHFVGRPVNQAPDLVEVTYQSDSPGGEALPSDALLFEAEDGADDDSEPVVDLRSLGAVEYKE